MFMKASLSFTASLTQESLFQLRSKAQVKRNTLSCNMDSQYLKKRGFILDRSTTLSTSQVILEAFSTCLCQLECSLSANLMNSFSGSKQFSTFLWLKLQKFNLLSSQMMKSNQKREEKFMNQLKLLKTKRKNKKLRILK